MNPIWTDYLDSATGIWQKRNVPGDRFECPGSVKTAVIDNRRVYLFVPADLRLTPVEAVPG